jgi:hypothetical protein
MVSTLLDDGRNAAYLNIAMGAATGGQNHGEVRLLTAAGQLSAEQGGEAWMVAVAVRQGRDRDGCGQRTSR